MHYFDLTLDRFNILYRMTRNSSYSHMKYRLLYKRLYKSQLYDIPPPPNCISMILVILGLFYIYIYIYNIRTLSVNIKFICTSFRNRQNSEPLASFSSLFRSEYKYILYLTTMYVYCVYPAMSKKSENLSDLSKRTETSVIPRLS